MTTKLCPAVQENIIRLQVMDEESGEIYAEHVMKNATLQAEWERERVKKALLRIQERGVYACQQVEIEMKELGIEQEEKK